MIKYTHVIPETNESLFHFHLHFISQSVPDIKKEKPPKIMAQKYPEQKS
jgi:hypothetical protein